MYASPEVRGSMPSSSKPRKKGRSAGLSKPQLVAQNPLIRHDAELERRMQLVPHLSLARFRMGDADEGDYHTIALRVHVGYMLALWHYPKATSFIEEVADVLVKCQEIGDATGFWSLNPDAADQVGHALVLTDEMQKECTKVQVAQAYEFVKLHAGQTAVN